MMRKIKKGSAWFLALALFLSAFVFSDVNAANGVETDRKCSISFELDGNLDGEFAELNGLEVPVKLYQVADISVTGAYKALAGYEKLGMEDVNSETTAAQWEDMAKQAMAVIEDSKAEPAKTTEIVNGKGKAEDLKTGMYLVVAEETLSPEYKYQFTPYLLSLPNNYYGTTGNDDWVYDVTTGLKPAKEERFGSLVINKTVTSFNETLGSATFVFQIEATKDRKKVYSDVVSMVFDTAGSKSLTVTGIPAGAEVTVTEVYSGASYELTSAASQNVTIVADPEEEPGVNAQPVAFTNAYNDGLNGGASVVNHFTVDEEGVWTVEQQSESTGIQE